jgi:hypothetical protein
LLILISARNSHERLGLYNKSCGQKKEDLFKIPYELKFILNFLKKEDKKSGDKAGAKKKTGAGVSAVRSNHY